MLVDIRVDVGRGVDVGGGVEVALGSGLLVVVGTGVNVGGGVDVALGSRLLVGVGIGVSVEVALGSGLLAGVGAGVGREVAVGTEVAVFPRTGELASVWAEMASTVRRTRTATVASASISGMAVSLGSAAGTAAWTVASIFSCGVARQPTSDERPTNAITPHKRPRMQKLYRRYTEILNVLMGRKIFAWLDRAAWLP